MHLKLETSTCSSFFNDQALLCLNAFVGNLEKRYRRHLFLHRPDSGSWRTLMVDMDSRQ